MAVPLADRKRLSAELKSWLDDVAAYERAFKQWEGRADKIEKRYRDDPRTGQKEWTSAKYNMLWANVQTLTAATFSRLPKPDVSRRYRDQDAVGRVAAMTLERDLDYHIQHYPEYRTAMRASVLDRFLGGRGTVWIRYEPHMRAVPPAPIDGAQVTDDVDTPDEELDYECVAVDYVNRKDFGHSVARTWEEVPRVWRKVYMTREKLNARFGPEIGKIVPLDADPRQTQPDRSYGAQDARDCATVYEGWDKSEKRAVWFSKGVKDFLDTKGLGDPGYVDFEDGFPCPPPLYSTLTNDSLVPVPDFVIYQDQANEMDIIADRKDGIIKALQVKGVYDGSIPELQRLFTEGENGTLIPGKNWRAFAEKNGLQGSLSLVDLKPFAEALLALLEAEASVKDDIYELTGISDIIRGQTEASETATAQQIKGQYASLRLKTYQDEVAVYASHILSLMAQVICRKFSPETIAKIAGVDQFAEQDKAAVPQALALLVGEQRMMDPNALEGPNPVREFRIEVASDSLVHLDEQAEQQARTEFLTATGGFLQNVAKSLAGVPPQMQAVLVPLYMDMLKFGVTGFRVGKQVEGAFDEAADRLKQLALQMAQPQAAPEPPEVQVAKIKQQTDMETAKAEDARERERMAGEQQIEREKIAGQQQIERERIAGEQALHRDKVAGEHAIAREQGERASQLDDTKHQREMSAKGLNPKAEVERQEDRAEAKQEKVREKQERKAEKDAERAERQAERKDREQERAQSRDASAQVQRELKELGQAIKAMVEQASRRRNIIRDENGRALGIE